MISLFIYLKNILFFNFIKMMYLIILFVLWGLGIGDWGLGIGDWGLGKSPNRP